MRLIVLLLGLLICEIAKAEWERLADTGEFAIYFDKKTVKYDGNTARLWMLYDYKKKSNTGMLSERMLVEHDCKEARARTLTVSWHSEPMSRGKSIAEKIDPGPWAYIPPETINMVIYKSACQRSW